MIILGIDPGTAVTGYGLIETDGSEIRLVDYGILKSPSRSPIGERLHFLFQGIQKVIERYRPVTMALEDPFMARNVKSALAIGRAQAAAMLAGASAGLPLCTYAPASVKQQVTGYGAGSKEQVQEMVRLHLKLDESPSPYDAADALAVAICCARREHLGNMVKEQGL